jgi:uncharacterized repeat protein (TIGR01451 family)
MNPGTGGLRFRHGVPICGSFAQGDATMTTTARAVRNQSFRSPTFWLGCCLLVAAATPAFAATTASSSAYGETIDLTLVPLLGGGVPIASGPLPAIAGSAPPSYDRQQTQAAVAVGGLLGLGNLLTTGLLTVNADSNVPAANQAHARAEADDASLLVAGLLQLSATTIVADASITGSCGSSLTAAGSTRFAGATVGGLAGNGLSIAANPAPNTELLNLLGIRVVLNEQTAVGDGTAKETLTVNALHIYLSNTVASLIGALSGDIVVSHAQAALDCNGLPDSADLSVSMSASPSPATQGQDLTYTITVANAGPNAASNVTVADALPAAVNFVSAAASQGSCSGTAAVACNLGPLGAAANATVTIVVETTQVGAVVNSVSAGSSTADPDAANDSASVSTTVNPPGGGSQAAVAITAAAAPSPATVGEALTYTLSVVNSGPDSSTAVVITDTLPAGVSFVSAGATQGSCSGTTTVSCALGNLAQGAGASVQILVVPSQAGTIVDNADVSAGTANPSPSRHASIATAVNPAAGGKCVPDAAVLCIDDQPGDRRFQVTTAYSTVEGRPGGLAGQGHAVSMSSLGVVHGGIFWFFSGENPEMMIKVLNACGTNQKFWVFYAAGTNVGLATTVIDTRTGRVRVYANPDLTAAPPVQDTEAFDCSAAGDLAPRPGAAAAPAGQEAAQLAGGEPAAAGAAAASACGNDATTLCIAGRFRVQVAYQTIQSGGKSGMGQAMPLAEMGIDRGGVFWFFDSGNPEMMIKVLDACALEQTFWVFYSADTNVGLTVTVFDVQTGRSVVYSNRDLTAARPVQDTRALPCS